MVAITYIIVFLCYLGSCAGQPSMFGSQGGCVMSCLQSFGEKVGASSSPPSVIGEQVIKIGNMTASCPAPMNKSDIVELDNVCGLVKDLIKCTDLCPEDMIKNFTSIGLKPMKLLCVDKIDDLKKYLPCLSQSCPDVERTCVPKCGSIYDLTQKLKAIGGGDEGSEDDEAGMSFSSMFSNDQPTTTMRSLSATTPSSMNQIITLAGQMCTTIQCHLNCARQPVLAKCGKEALALSDDMMKLVFSTLDSMSSALGFKDMLPDQCKSLMATSPSTGPSQQTTGAPVARTAAPPANVTTPSAAPKNETMPRARQLGASTKCEKPPCKGQAVVTVPSLLLLILAFVLVKANNYGP